MQSTKSDEFFDLNASRMRIGTVRLRVRDLERVSHFYQEVLGLKRIAGTAHRAVLGTATASLIELIELPAFVRSSPRSAGLFHTAFLLPRPALATWLAFVIKHRIQLSGASDHKVSEAIYLSDPEGNGIEVYADRPSTAWNWTRGYVNMPSEPLDVEDLLQHASGNYWEEMPDGAMVGHVHLRVGDLAPAESFYKSVLGFDVTRRCPGAVFLGSDGYHHQLAINTWHSRGAGTRTPHETGLDSIEIIISDETTRSAIAKRARKAALPCVVEEDAIVLQDPWGVKIRLR